MERKETSDIGKIVRHFRIDDFDSAAADIQRLVSSGTPFSDLWEQAARNRLTAYFAYSISNDLIFPSDEKLKARRIIDQHKAEYAKRLVVRDAVTNALSDVRHCFLKGLVIAEGGYPKPYLRSMGDIDLLVSPDDLWLAVDRLMEAGFQYASLNHIPWPIPKWLRQKPLPVDVDVEIILFRPGVVVELHPHLISPKIPHRVKMSELLEKVVGSSYRTLTPEVNWIHLLANDSFHFFSYGLGSLLDLAKWEDRYAIDPENTAKLIREWRLEYLVFPALARLKSLFPELPSVSFFGEHLHPSPLFPRNAPAFYWGMRSGQPVRTMLKNFFPSRAASAIRYRRDPKSARLWIDRACRPISLLRSYGLHR